MTNEVEAPTLKGVIDHSLDWCAEHDFPRDCYKCFGCDGKGCAKPAECICEDDGYVYKCAICEPSNLPEPNEPRTEWWD